MGNQFETSICKAECQSEQHPPIGSDTGLHPQRRTHVEPMGTVHELRSTHAHPGGRNQSTDRRRNRLGWTVGWQRQ